MWTRQFKDSRRELNYFPKQQIYMIPNIFPETMKIVHSNIIILLENLCRQKKHLSLRIGLSHTVHPIMHVSLSWKVVFIQDGRIILIYFYHLAMNSYLHQIIFPWELAILCIHWNIKMPVIIIIYVSCKVVCCLMTSSWI